MLKRIKLMSLSGLVICSVIGASCATGAAWKPAGDGMQTPWTLKVDPACPLPEYPRPQMVRQQWQNLNGLWDYAVTPKEVQQTAVKDGKILVPFAIESALSGVKRTFKPAEKLWYQRTFSVPSDWKGKQVLLHFGAVDYECQVYVNGKEAGKHRGSSDAFSFDITSLLKPAGEQVVMVSVTDPTNEGPQPRGKQVLNPKGIYYTAVSGIWKTVWLEPVEKISVRRFSGAPDIDKGTYTITPEVANATAGTKVKYTVSDNGRVVAEVVAGAKETAELKLNSPKLWSPSSPFLYDLKIAVLENGKQVDAVDSYFGMRKVSIAKDEKGIERIMLNNNFLFQYGFLDQGWWPDGLLTAPTDEALKYDIEFTKRAGYNTIRKHIKIESDRFYYYCDKMGMLVWQDAISGDGYNLKNRPKIVKSPESIEMFEYELKAMLDQLRNYPCIVNWVVFNEGWGQYGAKKMIDWTKQYDPTRLASVSGWVDFGNGDICDVHRYPGPGRIENAGPGRAYAVGEFGGLGLPVKGHQWNPDMNNWGYNNYTSAEDFTKAYERLVFQLHFLIGQGLSAAIYTQTTDVEGEVNGMLTYDREIEKIPAEKLAALHAPLYSKPFNWSVVLADSEKQPQQWSYTTEQPAQGWEKEAFNDSNWKKGAARFGCNNPDAQLGFPVDERTAVAHTPRTLWNTKEIWLRKDFTLNEVPENPYLWLTFDSGAEVYINGVLVGKVEGRKAHYGHNELHPFISGTSKVLRKGKNTICVYGVNDPKPQTNQYLDAGIVNVK